MQNARAGMRYATTGETLVVALLSRLGKVTCRPS